MSITSSSNIKMWIIFLLNSWLLCSLTNVSYGQKVIIDSLQTILKNTKSDSVRSDINEQIAYQYLYYKPDSSKIYIERSLELAKKINSQAAIAKAHNRMGTYNVVTSQYTDAILEFQKSLQYYKKSTDLNGLSTTYGNLGALDFYLKDYDAALENFHKSIKLLDTAKHTSQYTKEIINLGAVHREKKNLDSAYYYAKLSIAYSKKLVDKRMLSVANYNMGTAQFLLNQPEEALKSLNASLEQINVPLQFKLLATCYKAQVLNSLGKYNEAENLLEGLEQQILSLNDHYLTLVFYESKEVIYQSLNQYAKALTYSQRYKTLNKTVHNEEQTNIFQNIKAKYAQEERAYENELLRNESEIQSLQIERQKHAIYAVGIILVLLLVIIIILYRLYKFKAQNNQVLKDNQKRLNASNSDLAAINRQKDNLFSIVAHDVKSPLAAILNSINLLHEDHKNLNEEETTMVYSELQKQTSDLFYLIENVLVWAKSQMNGFKFSFSKLNTDKFIREALQVEMIFISRKNIKVVNNINKEETINTDSQVLRVLLRNLINNAVKFTPVDGTITFSTNYNKDNYHINITDTGIGISEDKIKKVLVDQERYTLKGTADEPGNGIGLILCQEIASKIGGHIEARSEMSKGSTFTLVIPTHMHGD